MWYLSITKTFPVLTFEAHRNTQAKRFFHYVLIAALSLMFSSTAIFWAGVIIAALDNQNGASTTLTQVQTYTHCLPTTADLINSCFDTASTSVPLRSLNPAPGYFTTITLVVVVGLLFGTLNITDIDSSDGSWGCRCLVARNRTLSPQ